MANSYFQFKQFIVNQDRCGMKVSTEACILGAWVGFDKPQRILDIGTGTGLLSLMLAQRYDCPIDAVEIDVEAAGQARDNFLGSPWAEQLLVHHMSIQAFAQSSRESYDSIICNPPFFANHQKANKGNKNNALHEGEHFSQKMLLESLQKLMTPDGKAYVLYPDYEMLEFISSADEIGLYPQEQLIVRNGPGKDVFRRVVSFGKRKAQMQRQQDLLIRKDNEYSVELREMMQPYYLR